MVGIGLFFPATFRGLICGSPPCREDEAVRCPASQIQVGRRSAHLLLTFCAFAITPSLPDGRSLPVLMWGHT